MEAADQSTQVFQESNDHSLSNNDLNSIAPIEEKEINKVSRH